MDADEKTIAEPLPKRGRSVRPDPALRVEPPSAEELANARVALDVIRGLD